MDDNARRDNGRPKQLPNQWMQQHQPSMKQIMAIMAERDAAIQERNLAISEKKKALTERDMAILQRDSSINDRNNAIMERDNAVAALRYREANPNMKHHHQLQLIEHYADEASPKQEQPTPPAASKPRRNNNKRAKDNATFDQASKKSKPAQRKVKMVLPNKQSNWKDQDLGLNQVPYDDTTMSVPGCSCTGVLRQCYKWGSGGWQSSCCTMTLSMYPLPTVPNKRHARVGGRKMSGSVFSKLLSRLAAEGYDLSNPVDLKEHWAKHGTNRYITIK